MLFKSKPPSSLNCDHYSLPTVASTQAPLGSVLSSETRVILSKCTSEHAAPLPKTPQYFLLLLDKMPKPWCSPPSPVWSIRPYLPAPFSSHQSLRVPHCLASACFSWNTVVPFLPLHLIFSLTKTLSSLELCMAGFLRPVDLLSVATRSGFLWLYIKNIPPYLSITSSFWFFMALFENISFVHFFFGLYLPPGYEAHRNMNFVCFLHCCLANLFT